MDNQNTIEHIQTTTPLPSTPPNLPDTSNTTPPEPPKKKANVPLIIVSILALCFAGLAIFFGIQYFMPKKEAPSEPEQTSTTSTDSQSEPASTPAVPTMAEEYKEVSDEILSTVDNIDSNWFKNLQNDSGVIFKPEGYNTYLPTRLSIMMKLLTENADSTYNTIKSKLEANGYTSLGELPLLSSAGPKIEGYLNTDKNMVCSIFNEGEFQNPNDPNDGYYYTQLNCAKTNWTWLTEDEAILISELETAYHDKTGEYPRSMSPNVSIKDSQYSPYQQLQTIIGGGFGLFYRTDPNAKWQFFVVSQSPRNCDEYNTDDLKKAYQGEVCYDGQTQSTVQP